MVSNEDTKGAEAVIVGEVVPELQVGKQVTTTKEKISAYFTIAAAAFGLISDGCKSPHASHKQINDILKTNDVNDQDQNNLMTMANVGGFPFTIRLN
jgi:hypothetical protein